MTSDISFKQEDAQGGTPPGLTPGGRALKSNGVVNFSGWMILRGNDRSCFSSRAKILPRPVLITLIKFVVRMMLWMWHAADWQLSSDWPAVASTSGIDVSPSKTTCVCTRVQGQPLERKLIVIAILRKYLIILERTLLQTYQLLFHIRVPCSGRATTQ